MHRKIERRIEEEKGGIKKEGKEERKKKIKNEMQRHNTRQCNLHTQ
jgi:hypothetical protein